MRNTLLTVCVVLIAVLVFVLPARTQEDQRVVEEVSVVNVLVPVRVFHKGKPVSGLNKKNFQLFENGQPQQINTFQEFTRQIKRHSSKVVKLPGRKVPSRFFVLVFNVFDYNKDVDKAITEFFKNVYRKTDKIVIVTPERTFNITNSREMLASMPVLRNMLKLYSKTAKTELNRIFKQLEEEVHHFFEAYFVDQASKVFLSNYQRLWKEFSRKYLIPDINKFYWFADVLKKVNMEKWVIVFQQREVFPQFKERSRIKKRIQDWIDGHPMKPTTPLLEQFLYKMDYVFKVSENFPLDKIQEVFFRANATFHVLLFRSSKSSMSQDFEYKEAVSDYENSFRSISRATGGDVVFTNKLVESLTEVSQRKDVYYILSYAPKEVNNKNRKIKVKVSDEDDPRKLDVFYIKNLRLNPGVKEEEEVKKVDVANFSFSQRLLTFSLVNYLQRKIKEKTIGVVEVRVMLMDSKTETVVFDQAKILEAKEAQTKIQIPFNALKKGKYHLILDLTDKLSNQSRIFTEKVRI